MTTVAQASPAWERFSAMSAEVHDMLIGAAQCRNHLVTGLAIWDEMSEDERRAGIEEALARLTRVGI